MPDQITTEDLYGTSKDLPQQPEGQAAPPPPEPLIYEETPEIPISQPPVPQPPTVANPPSPMRQDLASPGKKRGSCLRTAGIILLVIVLFVAGIWLSSQLRQWVPGLTGSGVVTDTTPTPTRGPSPTDGAVPAGPYDDWISYEVISGTTKAAVPGISFKLPPEVLAPVCDGAGCASQGTYLPGGTRFTVAARGANQTLRDYRGSIITDVNGTAFTTKEATASGRRAMEFSGVFAGRTVAGYAFSRMRGVMVEVTQTLSLEINHFVPSGIVADFEADDGVFDQILDTFTFSSVALPIVTATPRPATSSGN